MTTTGEKLAIYGSLAIGLICCMIAGGLIIHVSHMRAPVVVVNPAPISVAPAQVTVQNMQPAAEPKDQDKPKTDFLSASEGRRVTDMTVDLHKVPAKKTKKKTHAAKKK